MYYINRPANEQVNKIRTRVVYVAANCVWGKGARGQVTWQPSHWRAANYGVRVINLAIRRRQSVLTLLHSCLHSCHYTNGLSNGSHHTQRHHTLLNFSEFFFKKILWIILWLIYVLSRIQPQYTSHFCNFVKLRLQLGSV